MRRYFLAVAAKMAAYPPKKNPNGYQRTFQLQQGWLHPIINISSDGSEGTLVNPVMWAVYAQGPKYGGRGKGERQSARMRELGWQSITDVARDTNRLYVELMNRAIKGNPGVTTF